VQLDQKLSAAASLKNNLSARPESGDELVL
jgi:hypothetical protein